MGVAVILVILTGPFEQIFWKKTDPSEIENLQYIKIADSVSLSLFMRTNEKCLKMLIVVGII